MVTRTPKNQLLRYGIVKVIISVHGGDGKHFNHAKVFFRDVDNYTRIEMTAQRHRLDMPDIVTRSLYPTKPQEHDRPEAPFDFGDTPYGPFYGLKVSEVRQGDPFDFRAFERAAKMLKRLSEALSADEVRSLDSRDELAQLVWVLEKVTHTPIEWNLTLESERRWGHTSYSPYTMPYDFVGKSYRYWAEQRGEKVFQRCPKCSQEVDLVENMPKPDLCASCFEELSAKEKAREALPAEEAQP